MQLRVLGVAWPHHRPLHIGVTQPQGVAELMDGGRQQVIVPRPDGRIAPAFRLVEVDSPVFWEVRMRKNAVFSIELWIALPFTWSSVNFAAKTGSNYNDKIGEAFDLCTNFVEVWSS